MKSFDAIVAGHICLDITPNFPQNETKLLSDILQAGKLSKVSGVSLSTGGAVSNTGIAMSILGISTGLMGKIGDDYFGNGVIQLLKDRGIEDGMVISPGERTSYTLIIVPPGTDRVFIHDPGANDTFSSQDIDYNLVRNAKLFHFGYPPLMRAMYLNNCSELITMFKKIKELGLTTSLDMAWPDAQSEAGKIDWKLSLENLLPYIDVFVPSIEEILYMMSPDLFLQMSENNDDIIEKLTPDILSDLGQKLINLGTKILMIKCGAKGIYLKTANQSILRNSGKSCPSDIQNWSNLELFSESFHIEKVASATGAGDSCIAGFLSALLKDKNPYQSLAIASGAGALTATVYDTLSALMHFDALEKRTENWEKNHSNFNHSEWLKTNYSGIWQKK